MAEVEPRSRAERRKLRTRQSLLRAAQQLLAEGRTAVSVLDIATLAGVGNGSFYNHFATKDELFDAAVTAVIDDHAHVLRSFGVAESDIDTLLRQPVPEPPLHLDTSSRADR